MNKSKLGIIIALGVIIVSSLLYYTLGYTKVQQNDVAVIEGEEVTKQVTEVTTDLHNHVEQIIEQDLVGEWYLDSDKYSYVMASSDMVYDLLMLQRKDEPEVYDLAYYKIDKENNVYVTVTEKLANGELTPLAETSNYLFRLVQDDVFIYSLYKEDGERFILEFNQENLKLIEEEETNND